MLLVAACLQAGYVFFAVFALAAFFQRRGAVAEEALASGLAALGTIAMAAFWVAWISLPGQLAATSLRWAVAITLVALGIQAIHQGQWRDKIAHACALAFIATAVLLFWIHAGTDLHNALRVAANRWTHELPGDNAIPLDFAKAFAAGVIPHPLHADWLSSDRPPVQTALYFLTPGFLIAGPADLNYQAASVAFQMTVLIGVWCIVGALTGSRKLAAAAVLAAFLTPLVLVNGAYVWPKLLASAYLCGAFVLHFSSKPGRGFDGKRGMVVGALCALAMLAHGGAFFGLVGIGLAALMLRRWGGARYLLGLLVAVVALYGPWIAYQKLSDPPGDRLLKWHLAGVTSPDPRPLGTVLIEAYRAKSFDVWLAERKSNVELLGMQIGKTYGLTRKAAVELVRGEPDAAEATLKRVRINQFFGVVIGTGLFGFTLFVLPLLLVFPLARALSLTLFASYAAWVLVMFGGNQTIIHQGVPFLQVGLIALAVSVLGQYSVALALVFSLLHAGLALFQYLF